MSENKEQCRAEFEAWERNNASNLERDASGQYVNPCVQSAWEGYQAGRAAPPVVELSDDCVIQAVRAYIAAGKRGLDLQGAMRCAVQEAMIAAAKGENQNG